MPAAYDEERYNAKKSRKALRKIKKEKNNKIVLKVGSKPKKIKILSKILLSKPLWIKPEPKKFIKNIKKTDTPITSAKDEMNKREIINIEKKLL